jgi:ADP-heptose:LPS heptosyltransferase
VLDARHPAAIFANGAGDHLLTLPALRALVSLFPNRLSLICMAGTSESILYDLCVSKVYQVEMQSSTLGWTFDADDVAARIGQCDLFLSLNPWNTSSVDTLVHLLSPKISVGFFPEFTIALPRDFTKHSADLAFDIPQALDSTLQLEDFAAPPAFRSEHRRFARKLRAEVPEPMKVLAIHTETKPEKTWPKARFVGLLDSFLERHSEFVAFVLDYDDSGLDAGREGDRVIPCCHLPLPVAFSLVAESDLFLGVDSCMLHAADLFRVPGVALFGPTRCQEWGFRLAPHRHVCGAQGMNAIREADVCGALEDLLTEKGAAQKQESVPE